MILMAIVFNEKETQNFLTKRGFEPLHIYTIYILVFTNKGKLSIQGVSQVLT